MRKQAHRRRQRAGFTLMEVLLVLVILVMLGSLAVSAFTGTRDRADRDTAKSQVELIDRVAKKFQFDMRRYPASFDELMQTPSDAKPGRWAGPYLDRQVPLDPWDNPYQIVSPGQYNLDSVDVWSMGPDGASGSEDDIGNWEMNVQQ
jgi:general secretion pathway protein G